MPDQAVEQREVRARIDRAIKDLPERQREAFVLKRIQGLSYEQAGKEMGVSPRTVEHQVKTATTKLRRALRPLRPGAAQSSQ